MRAKFLSAAAVLLTLSYPAIGTAQNQNQQQTQASSQPTQQIRQKLQQAEQVLRQRDEQGAQQILDQASRSADEAIRQSQGQQRQMLNQVQQEIRQAQQALQQRDQQGAVQALAQARQLSEQPMTAQQTTNEGKATTAARQERPTAQAELERPLDTEEIIGQTALTPEGEDLGEIGDLLMSEEGDIEAAIIDVGGFLGIGKRQVAVDWNKVRMSTANDQIVVDMTREEFEAAPEYNAQ